MQAYICTICGYLYDNESHENAPDGKPIPFSELDRDWMCPNCGTKAGLFKPTYSIRTEDLTSQSLTADEQANKKKKE
ncbi:MAG: rubredoxin [Planctomycetes bacterium]|nr:rubredoxin [Planctomycetota bacterium]